MVQDVTTNHPTISIVDDDDAVRDSLAAILSSLGYESSAFESCEAFLEQVRNNPEVECLLLDFHLPGMNGLELLEALSERTRNFPVIMVTAHGDQVTRDHAMRLGAQAVLDKPVDFTVLLDAIHNALSPDVKEQH